MTASQVVDKLMASEHADVLRESVAWVVAELMEAEVRPRSARSSASAPGERTSQRNGYRPRNWSTRAGEVELAIPRLRTGSCGISTVVWVPARQQLQAGRRPSFRISRGVG